MKKKILLFLTLFLILVGCGENGSIEDLWSDYQGEVFVRINNIDWSDIYGKDLSGLSRYEFMYLDNKVLHNIVSFAKLEEGDYVSTEDGVELAREETLLLEDAYLRIPKTSFFIKKTEDETYHDFYALLWFDEEEACIRSVHLDEALGETLTKNKLELEDIIPKIQTRETDIFNIKDTCYYYHLEGGSYDLIKQDFVDDLKPEEKLGLETPFEFRDMKINVTGIESWSKVDNRYSDYYGRDVFLLAVELENLSDEKNKLNMFSYKTFDPEGKESPNISSYFDKTLQHHEELLSGGKTRSLYPILYNGDGEYQIHFGDEKVVFLEIKKH